MKNKIAEAITLDESKRFVELEKTIKAGKQTFLDVGLALAEIRDSRLYRADYGTFENYCAGQWGFTRRHVNGLIAGAKAVKALPDDLGTKVPNSGTAKAVAAVPETERAAVVERAAAAGPVTARAIAAAAKEPETVIEMDREGQAIPAKMLELWHQADADAKEMLSALSRIRSAVRASQESDHVAYRELNHSSTIGHLSNAYGDIQRVKPHAVCHSCRGNRPEKCLACKGRGYVSKYFWDMCVPEEFKKLKK